MSKKLLNLLLVIMMLAVFVPTTLAAPPAQEGQDYVVVADDWLSKLADKYLGNPFAYPAIVEYTNQKHAEDASYAEITDPDLIEVGWKIYIPSAEEAAALAPTPIPWPTPKLPPPTPMRTPSYPVDVPLETKKLVDASQGLYRLIQSAEVDNPGWISNAIINASVIDSSYSYLSTLDAPPEMVEFHNMLLDAVSDCYKASEYFAPTGPREINEDELKQVEGLLMNCQERVAEPMQIIEETFATR